MQTLIVTVPAADTQELQVVLAVSTPLATGLGAAKAISPVLAPVTVTLALEQLELAIVANVIEVVAERCLTMAVPPLILIPPDPLGTKFKLILLSVPEAVSIGDPPVAALDKAISLTEEAVDETSRITLPLVSLTLVRIKGEVMVGAVARTILPVPVWVGRSVISMPRNPGAPAVTLANSAEVAVVDVGATTKAGLVEPLSSKV